MSSEMIERATLAIANANEPQAKYTSLDQVEVRWRTACLSYARAAIEAIREPTKEMVIAGDDAKENCIDSDWSSDADGNRHDYTTINSDLPAIVFRAMIDAALAAPPVGGI